MLVGSGFKITMIRISRASFRRVPLAALAVTPWLACLGTSSSGRTPVAPRPGTAYEEGLAIWRKVGFVDHAACASCHGPDGLEIAIYNFDDATIKRRALVHVDEEDADRLVDFIHAVREKDGIKKLLDPMVDRPLQPGGSVLPGATPMERDAAFAEELETRLPTLLHGRIHSDAEAIKAKNEFLGLDAWDLRIGIEFNRISEDVFHGKDHASIAAWLPDLPRVMSDEERKALFALEDAYLANPSDENFFAMFEGADKYTHLAENTPAALMSRQKYLATLIVQHLMRKEVSDGDKPRSAELFGWRKKMFDPDPVWEFGDLARRYAGSSLEDLRFPESVVVKKTGGPSLDEQLKSVRLSWLWAGWLMDQGLQKINRDRQLRTGQYMSTTLLDDGPYPTHNVFFSIKRMLTQSFDPDAWSSGAKQHLALDYSALMRGQKHLTFEPTEPAHRKRYQTFLSNSFRMSMFLLWDELSTTHVSWGKDSNRATVNNMADYLNHADPDDKAWTEAMRAKLVNLIGDCGQELPVN